MSSKTQALKLYLSVCPDTNKFKDSVQYAKIKQFFINWLNTLPNGISWNRMMLLGTDSMRDGLPELTDTERRMISVWVEKPTYTAWCKLVMLNRMGG